jgi:hypothetical protein
MLVFEFNVSLVISWTNEIYIEKNHKQFKKNQKKEKPSLIVFLCQILTNPLDKQVLYSFLMSYPRFTPLTLALPRW